MTKTLIFWIAFGLAGTLGFEAAGFDFDEVMMVCMGFAGVAYIIADLKRERRLDQFAINICEEIAGIKAVIGSHSTLTLAERVSTLENESQWLGGEVTRVDDLAKKIEDVDRRVDATNSRLDPYDFGGLCDRVTILEARADFKPWSKTRKKDGKFASSDTPEEELLKEGPAESSSTSRSPGIPASGRARPSRS